MNYTKKRIGIVLLVLCTIAQSTSAGNGSEIMSPGMGSTWLAGAGVDFQETLDYLLGALAAAVFICYVLFSGIAGITIMSNTGTHGDPTKRSSGQTAILNVFLGLFVVVLFIRLGGQFFEWF